MHGWSQNPGPKRGKKVQKVCTKFHYEAQNANQVAKTAARAVHVMKKCTFSHKMRWWVQNLRCERGTKFHYEAQNANRTSKTCWCART